MREKILSPKVAVKLLFALYVLAMAASVRPAQAACSIPCQNTCYQRYNNCTPPAAAPTFCEDILRACIWRCGC